MAAWRAPDGMTALFERFDPRIGGGYRMVLRYEGAGAEAQGKTAPGMDVVEVRFAEMLPDERIVEEVRFLSDDPAFSGTMTLTTAFTPMQDGTRVSFHAVNVPAGITPEDHQAGMTASLRNLARFTE